LLKICVTLKDGIPDQSLGIHFFYNWQNIKQRNNAEPELRLLETPKNILIIKKNSMITKITEK
jgi:hypothetical protein